ncbi:hypothetical protein CHS0354_020761 [Potamilus streckersoni]|uniref:SAC domain-containing protein n=1 Tax=Potamilus streckersoni TaxID=2493646 RepID=A0AAE0SCB8_9BIVA|nr:hypothetical protein CHS0354_020761 [Potamilus streckersoni]
MELHQTKSHYIILDGEYSLWCDRTNGRLKPKAGYDLASAWNPVCIGQVYGVIGKLKLHPDSEWKLLLIRQRSCIGKIAGGHNIYKINKIAVLSLSEAEPDLELELCRKHHFGLKKVDKIAVHQDESQNKLPFQKMVSNIKSAAENVKPKKKEVKDREKFERRIMEELTKMYNDSDFFYYSDTFDLTNSLQRQNAESYTVNIPHWQRCDVRFFWNEHMLKELIELKDDLASHWIQPIIQGYVQIEICDLDFTDSLNPCSAEPEFGNKNRQSIQYTLSVISRRSQYQAGTRSRKRGLDETGACSNYVETEQVIEFNHHLASFVQVRGSIPVFWSQSGFKYRPPPKLDRE